jgi:hypothetical protein
MSVTILGLEKVEIANLVTELNELLANFKV